MMIWKIVVCTIASASTSLAPGGLDTGIASTIGVEALKIFYDVQRSGVIIGDG